MTWPIVVLTLILAGVPATLPTATRAAPATPAAMAAEEYVANAAELCRGRRLGGDAGGHGRTQ